MRTKLQEPTTLNFDIPPPSYTIILLITFDLNPGELHNYPFIISINRCDGRCNTAEDPFGIIRIPNKIRYLFLSKG